MKNNAISLAIAFSALLSIGCSKEGSQQNTSNETAENSPGALLVKKNCKVCHAQGINGAPIIGNKKMWGPRLGKSIETLTSNAINGVGLMPAKGGSGLTDEEMATAVTYMVSQVSE